MPVYNCYEFTDGWGWFPAWLGRPTYGCHRYAGGQNWPPSWVGTVLREVLGPAEATCWVQWVGPTLESGLWVGRLGRLCPQGKNGSKLSGVSKADGEYQKWHLLVLLFPGKVPANSCPSSMGPEIVNKSPSCMDQVFFKLLPLSWVSEQASLCTGPIRAES